MRMNSSLYPHSATYRFRFILVLMILSISSESSLWGERSPFYGHTKVEVKLESNAGENTTWEMSVDEGKTWTQLGTGKVLMAKVDKTGGDRIRASAPNYYSSMQTMGPEPEPAKFILEIMPVAIQPMPPATDTATMLAEIAKLRSEMKNLQNAERPSTDQNKLIKDQEEKIARLEAELNKKTNPPPAPCTLPAIQKRFAVVIGISDYKFHDDAWGLKNLNFAGADATAFAAALESPGSNAFEIIKLVDKDATTTAIRKAIREKLRKVQPNDLVIIYWSGHGASNPEDPNSLYLITHDTDPAGMASTGYSMEEFKKDLGKLAAKRIIVMADTCHSAGIADPAIGFKSPPANKIVEGLRGIGVEANAAAQFNPGIVKINGNASPMFCIFTSCEEKEYSREDAKLGKGQGVFTHFLLKGLSGDADLPANGGNGDGKVSLGELIEYTRSQVLRQTGNQQHPGAIGSIDRDFILGEPKK